MFRAPHTRGEAPPTAREHDARTTPVESLLALTLCAIVLLASTALLRRSSDYTHSIETLVSESSRQRVPRTRAQGIPVEIDPPPELVLVLALDGLRADRTSLQGYARETSPNLDAVGKAGVVFQTVGAQSSHPLTSLKSLFTGKYPATLMLEETGADLLEQSSEREPRHFLIETFGAIEGRLAAGFRDKGYRTAAFGAGIGFTRAAGFASGFDTFEELEGGWEAVLERALGWLDENKGVPAFLVLRADGLAFPYRPDPKLEGLFCPDHSLHVRIEGISRWSSEGEALAPADLQGLSDHYDECVRGIDEHLGRFLEDLGSRSLLEKALVVVTSSHGESLGENGTLGHGGLSPEELRVPLVLGFPKRWHIAPSVIDDPVELVDLLPTLFLMCGVPLPEGLDGHSLLPTLLRGVRGRHYLVAQTVLDEGPLLRSSAAMRALLVPGRWEVLQDNERGEASFLALEGTQRASYPIHPEEFMPLLDLLLTRERPDPWPALEESPLDPFSAGIEHELERLGYDPSALAGPRRTRDLR